MKIEGSNNLQAVNGTKAGVPAEQAAGPTMNADSYVGTKRAAGTVKAAKGDGRLVQRAVGGIAVLAGIGLFVAAAAGLALLGTVTFPVAMAATTIGIAMLGSSFK